MSSSEEQVTLLFEFLHHVSSLSTVNSKTNEDGFAAEFHELKAMSADLKTNNQIDTKVGSLPVNKKKNRYKDILPFESRRVELHPIEGEEGSDYINASYITDPLNKSSYIAAQGPNSCTVEDFWRLLWYYAIEIVVMACREVELGKSKCKNYWVSPGEVRQFGAITVTHISEENITEDFIQRKMHIRCGDENQMITQLHYTGWPDHGVPSDVLPILSTIKKIRTLVPYGNDVPIVIHCSAGCGRTGALIGIDYARSLLEMKKFQTPRQVYEIVRNMRLQRPAMVQTKDQYILVYKAVFHLVRQYLDDYQHDPSVAHMFDASITMQLSQISLPEYQNPSGLDEVVQELGGELNEEEFASSGHSTPMQTPKSSYDLNAPNLKPQTKTPKLPTSTRPDLPKKPLEVPKKPIKPSDPIPKPVDSFSSDTNAKPNDKPIVSRYNPPVSTKQMPDIPTRPPAFDIRPRPEKQVRPSVKPVSPLKRTSLSEVDRPNPQPELPLSLSMPINTTQKLNKIMLPPSPQIRTNVSNEKLNEILEERNNTKPFVTSSREEKKPLFPAQPKPTPVPPPATSTTQQAISSISELLTQASLDKGPDYSDDDDEDDYWDPKNNQPVAQAILQGNMKSRADTDDENEYWEPKNNQPVLAAIQQSKKAPREKISLSSNRSNSPPPLLPPRPLGGSQTNLASQASLDLCTEFVDAPPIPLKSMQDLDLMQSTEMLSPPPSSSLLVPIPVVTNEDDYDVIVNVEKEISPITSPPEIYKSPRSDPVIPPPSHTTNGKPVTTAPYQPKGKIGMGGLIASIKKTDLFKQKYSIPTISHSPNIPISETVVTTDEQRRLNKRGRVEYGPVGYGIRLGKPNGPRTIPQTWNSYARESL
ncbi:Tyrosine-protein phosphatase non-receptor type 22-like [Oopsacas minuta]|uniref:protein-tyrosine-phosphatase n=1 Tax=Oopsacas minuta TaxID=111878 RepID=A0AAV7JY31_9METZ|nr:Tyrosine-protein phosphatase non-receptor type 22-like [Oopsacas minuta]